MSSFERYTVQVIDGNIESLAAHVYSSDDDLGNKTMVPNDAFHWNFRMNIGGTTKFVGEFFQLDEEGTPMKKAVFNVFDKDVASDCGRNIIKENKCFWLVTTNGFFFAKNKPISSGWAPKHQWS